MRDTRVLIQEKKERIVVEREIEENR